MAKIGNIKLNKTDLLSEIVFDNNDTIILGFVKSYNKDSILLEYHDENTGWNKEWHKCDERFSWRKEYHSDPHVGIKIMPTIEDPVVLQWDEKKHFIEGVKVIKSEHIRKIH